MGRAAQSMALLIENPMAATLILVAIPSVLYQRIKAPPSTKGFAEVAIMPNLSLKYSTKSTLFSYDYLTNRWSSQLPSKPNSSNSLHVKE